MTPRKPKTDQKRLPRTRQAKNPLWMQITERDVELLRALVEYRFLYIEQYAWLFPQDSARGILNRLRLLWFSLVANRRSAGCARATQKIGIRRRGLTYWGVKGWSLEADEHPRCYTPL
ncbi:hypothetical protein IIA79_04130 [bacterium]|nr:hypothetical protein [bacterium]